MEPSVRSSSAYLRSLKWKPPIMSVMQQPGHDLLDVLGLIVMAGIDQDVSLRARRARQQESHAPVGDVSVIKSGLERLVLDQQALLGLSPACTVFSVSSNHPILFRMLWVPG